MYEVFMQVLNFIKTQEIVFEWNSNTYTFTFWEIIISVLVIELGIYVIGRIIHG